VHNPVYLVRHGQSEWNAQRRIQGQTPHPPLTALGRRQARAAARCIQADLGAQPRTVLVITTSDLVRAAQTAAILTDLLGGTVRSDPRLREQHLGSWQGLTVDLAAAEQTVSFTGGESAQQLRARMAEALSVVDPSAVNILVSHGRAIRQAVGQAEGLAAEAAERMTVGNGAVARLYDGRIDWLGEAGQAGVGADKARHRRSPGRDLRS
jgi:probable phosphoglycerate mutase